MRCLTRAIDHGWTAAAVVLLAGCNAPPEATEPTAPQAPTAAASKEMNVSQARNMRLVGLAKGVGDEFVMNAVYNSPEAHLKMLRDPNTSASG